MLKLLPVLGLVAILLLVAIIARALAARSGQAAGYVAKTLLSDNEREFFARLVEALPDHRIFSQVAMSALVSVDTRNRRANYAMRNRFSAKVVDFVVCTPALEVIALVELDDRTHNVEKDAARDAITRAAGYHTIRFQSRRKPSPSEIRQQVLAPTT